MGELRIPKNLPWFPNILDYARMGGSVSGYGKAAVNTSTQMPRRRPRKGRRSRKREKAKAARGKEAIRKQIW